MPNWCNNTLTLTHEDPAMILRAKEALDRGEFLSEFIPVPEDLKIVAGSVGDPDEQKELERKTAENRDKYGYGNWYDFCVAEWGTKWDIGHGDGYEKLTLKDIKNNTIKIGFDSAWSPPTDAYEKLYEMGFQIRAMYYEGGCCFCGIWDNGIDESYDIQGNSNWVKRNIPREIDEEFAISMNMAEWESEQEEENAETEES